MTDLLRVYAPEECTEPGRARGYPLAWDQCPTCDGEKHEDCSDCFGTGSIKRLIRWLAGDRCIRCRHPFRPGEHGEFSPCDEQCSHGGPYSWRRPMDAGVATGGYQEIRDHVHHGSAAGLLVAKGFVVKAQWRVLTVHHLNEVKADCRWWNLAALCQRCHLNIQTRVKLQRPWPYEHSEWFKPYAAGYYASAILGEELDRAQTMARLDELLELEHRQQSLEVAA